MSPILKTLPYLAAVAAFCLNASTARAGIREEKICEDKIPLTWKSLITFAEKRKGGTQGILFLEMPYKAVTSMRVAIAEYFEDLNCQGYLVKGYLPQDLAEGAPVKEHGPFDVISLQTFKFNPSRGGKVVLKLLKEVSGLIPTAKHRERELNVDINDGSAAVEVKAESIGYVPFNLMEIKPHSKGIKEVAFKHAHDPSAQPFVFDLFK